MKCLVMPTSPIAMFLELYNDVEINIQEQLLKTKNVQYTASIEVKKMLNKIKPCLVQCSTTSKSYFKIFRLMAMSTLGMIFPRLKPNKRHVKTCCVQC